MSLASRLSLASLVVLCTGCSLLKQDEDGLYICLDDVLDTAGLSREDLGLDSDEEMRNLITAQEDTFGGAILRDCRAAETARELTGGGDTGSTTDGTGGTLPDSDRDSHEAGDAEDGAQVIDDVVDERAEDQMDLVILLDTTGSMRDDEAAVAAKLAEVISTVAANSGRIGLASYGDNDGCDSPWFDSNDGGFLDTTQLDPATIEAELATGIMQTDGCDWPESMYDGIHEALDTYQWSSTTSRSLIVLTDADAKQPPESTHSAADVDARLTALGVNLDIIVVGISY